MGQQIASDHEMFAGAVAGMAATRSVDLSLDGALDEESDLDMDFATVEGGTADDIIDLGKGAGDEGLDLDTIETSAAQESDTIESAPEVTAEMPEIEVTDATAEMPTAETDLGDGTAEMPTAETPLDDLDATAETPFDDAAVTAETPTIEHQFQTIEETGELPSLASDEATKVASLDEETIPADATTEIDLDDLGLDLEGIAEASFASDLDDTTEHDALEATGKNVELDVDAGSGADIHGGPEIDSSLLDATGQTQILREDLTVEAAAGVDDVISDQDKTLVASGFDDDDTVESPISDADTVIGPMDDDSDESTVLVDMEDEFDFAKTESLPKDAFTPIDADLGNLAGVFGIVEDGDTVDQARDDETIDQPGSGDLHDDARTMTEVGTKLDLARAYVDMGDPGGARSILEEVLNEGDDSQKQQAQQLLDSLPG
jgi:pilus assembly protein FimV